MKNTPSFLATTTALILVVGATCRIDFPAGIDDNQANSDADTTGGQGGGSGSGDITSAGGGRVCPGGAMTSAAGSIASAVGGSGTPPGNAPDSGVVGPLSQGPTSWTGYIENYSFPSGSDAVHFTFSVDSTGNVVGTVILGNGTPPPPATDPNVGYPPGYTDRGPNPGYLAEGFAYSMLNGISSALRLRFGISSSELWAGWCALQTPPVDCSSNCLPWGGCSCLPNWGGSEINGQCSQTNPANGKKTIIDCGKWNLCLMDNTCTCSTTACVVNSAGGLGFDLAISGNTANGGVTGLPLSSGSANVLITQDP